VRALALSLEAGLATSLSCVVTRKNAEHVGAVADMALGLGIGTIILNCFHATGQGANQRQLEVSAAEFETLVKTLRTDIGDAAHVVVGSPPPLAGSSRSRRISRITVSPFGDLKLCSQSADGVVNVRTEPDQFEAFLDAVSRNDFSGYVDRIDSCTCR
jgi:MoaA/NifB/PqqE/SkfB family radical SAM enzyme